MARSLGLTVTAWSPLARGALAVRLDGKQLERLDAATRVRREYPYDFLYVRPPHRARVTGTGTGDASAEHRWRLWNAEFEQGVPRV
ncbi:hypothetical protein [Streptomyces mirabilis]|uniref:hypothetical protein n=1 Tax=Streptomyces mirabilis TaxID=68239 RepID=UPI0022C52BE9|nr:hypothetical protein [Streptomyces mirabilis]